MSSLEPFFNPRGVAVIGASSNPRKLSHGILKNLTRYGYQGKVYPVNPGSAEILGLPCYPDIASVPNPVDLAVVVVPAPGTPKVLEACGERGIRAVTIITGGFREVGEQGQNLEAECLEIARRYSIRLIGPNCVGTMNLHTGLDTTFIDGVPDKGGIAFVSQSGAICGGVVDLLKGKKIGFSHFLSLGNEADVSETDMIEYLGDDPKTRVIACYVEAIRNGRRFLEVARKVSAKKPIVLLKAGQSSAGARAVSSHTGSLAGSMAAYRAAFEQSGVIEVHTFSQLFELALSFDLQPLPRGNRVALVTNAGGPAALVSDGLAQNGLTLADLSAETTAHLREILNPAAQIANPIDMLGGAEPREYGLAAACALKDPGVDAVCVINVPTALVDPGEIARSVSEAATGSQKMLLTCVLGDASITQPRLILHENRIPFFVYPESVGFVISAMLKYSQWQRMEIAQKASGLQIDPAPARALFEKFDLTQNLGEAHTRPLLEAYGIPVISGGIARSKAEAVDLARKLGFPVALKIVSPDILHKSDAGGIRLNLRDENAVGDAYRMIYESVSTAHPDAVLEGVLVESMAPRGQEVIVGMQRDPNFGPLIMFGMGGIYVELFKDVSFRIAPVTREEARQMIHDTHAGRLLTGFRGQKVADLEAVVDCILRISQFALDFPEVQEVEVNPLLVMPEGQGALALDGRIILH